MEQTKPLVCTCFANTLRNVAKGYYDADKTMIKHCPIIPINQYGIYANGVDAKLLKDMYDL